ncbi:Hypothetical predicted protein [Mytilus galloprovincialis]|uniref:Uncharacterized protein n=1 Tax=Mytilus galloprovincialis TaxID=29158 RepID=A0A8B6EFH9_MYTGA|nr:Hypothetical predicted protein [Mytilus galloprovincialis]
MSNVDDKTVREINVETKVVKRLAGTGRAGSEDGCQTTAQFQQPTSVCSEKKTVFVCDNAVGQVKLITPSSSLLKYLEILHKLLSTFGFTKDKHNFSIDDAISRLTDIDDCLCDIEIKTITSEKDALQGPDGANSMQTKHDISQLITALKSLRDVVNKTEPLFKAKLSLKSTFTTIVENIFSEMKGIDDTPLMIQFARRFSNCVRELFKRITQMCFLYFTSEYSHLNNFQVIA